MVTFSTSIMSTSAKKQLPIRKKALRSIGLKEIRMNCSSWLGGGGVRQKIVITVVKVIPGFSAYKKSEFRGSLKSDPKLNRLGRSKAIHQAAEICNNFNSTGCTFKDCNFLHVCKVCKSPYHGNKSVKPKNHKPQLLH